MKSNALSSMTARFFIYLGASATENPDAIWGRFERALDENSGFECRIRATWRRQLQARADIGFEQ
jgi:hypothetical protein